MKYTRTAALAAVGAAAVFSLTACTNGASGKDASSHGSSSSSSSSTSEEGSKAEDEEGSGEGSGKDTQARAGSGDGAPNPGGKAASCTTDDLAIAAEDAATDEDSGRITITMVNRGSSSCSATGFAGVDIKDVDHTSNPVHRADAEPRVTTLKPGESAVFNLAYEIDDSGDSLAHPTHLVVTPPNETHPVSLKWPESAGEIKGAYTDVELYPTHRAE